MPPPPSTRFPIERSTLPNGLRVVMAPDRSAPVVAVAVFYDVGFRSEPEGRTGFAHLFEHMMFQGSETLEKGEFDRLMMGNGGVLNGTTTPDFTNYFEVLPSAALELALFLEADRMASLRLDQENLDNQIAVVKEEIRLNVLNRPYGKFPWILLPELMFDTFANSHDGYGSFEDLEAAGLDDVVDFFAQYYAPANAALVLAGDFDPDEAAVLVERHFGPIRRRRAPIRPSFAEPLLRSPRRRRHTDALAPTPALVMGYRVPDPIGQLDELLACQVLTAVLADGRGSRLHRRLVRDHRLVTAVDSWIGLGPGWSGPLEMRDPTRLQIQAFYPRTADTDAIVAAVDEEIDRLGNDLTAAEVTRVVTRAAARHVNRADSVLNRALALGPLELQRGRPELLNDYPRLLDAVDRDQVGAVAERWLAPSGRALLEVVPGGRE